MNILITGHLGFVGSCFWERLAQDPANTLTGVDIKAGPSYDARDFFRTNDQHYDLVIHLAAVVGGRQTIEGSPLSVAVDLSIDSEMFQWALRTRPGRIIYYSSSAAYPIELQTFNGENVKASHHTSRNFIEKEMQLKERDINLDAVRSPDLSYGWSKLTGEYLAQFVEAEGVRTHVFRPFSGYGETQSLDYPFPSFIKRGHEMQDPFEIWGDGTQVRDFIHIDDVVSATLEAVKQDVPGPVNLGWGRAISFNELRDLVVSAVNDDVRDNGNVPERYHYRPETRYLGEKPVGVSYRVCDPTKMLSFYTPKITLEEGIRRSLDVLD